MVKRLPDKVEGVMLKDGQIKLKPGYKFVKRTNGTVAVARISGSVGLDNTIGGTWACTCYSDTILKATGKCGASFANGSVQCDGGTCEGSCVLSATVQGARTNVIMY
jgi:hypothetical protein